MFLCVNEEVVGNNVNDALFFSSLWHGTFPECYSGHHVAHAQHG